MRLLLALLAATTLSTVAHADQYDFKLTGVYTDLFGIGPYTDEFVVNTTLLLPRKPDSVCGPPDCFSSAAPGGYDFVDRYGRVDLLDNERGDYYPDATYFFALNPEDIAGDFPLFTGPVTDPVLATGNFYWTSFLFDGYARGTATITDLSTTSPVPEPSTLTLIGTGALGLAAALRRRLA